MTDRVTPREPELLWWLAAAVVTTGAFWVGIGPSGALVAGLWMFGVLAILVIGRRRSDAVRAILGSGDERDRLLYTRAMAAAGTVVGLVVTGWWLLTVAQGQPDPMLFNLTILFSGTFFAAAILGARMG